jgi:hypothetical protein
MLYGLLRGKGYGSDPEESLAGQVEVPYEIRGRSVPWRPKKMQSMTP